ncbi:MAG: GIY-YIG nuclease family protein [Gemmataceae bacterium]
MGLTRRLEPDDRIRELSGAAVPFPFDVHMMISCEDAPKLEYSLHKCLHKCRVNKANVRKEFFKTTIEEIQGLVVQNHGEVEYLADVEALEFNQSLSMPDEDQEFVESVYDSVGDEDDGIDLD